MMHAPVRTVAPAELPVTLAEVKVHLDELASDRDERITLLLKAATDRLDGWSGVLGRALVDQTWRQDFDGFAPMLRLPMPAEAVVSVTYVDLSGATQTIDPANYVLKRDALGSFVGRAYDYQWPDARAQVGAVSVTFDAGWDADDVPYPLRAAICLLVRHLYDNPEGGDLPVAVDALIAPYVLKTV